MVKPDVRIETNRQRRQRAILAQQAVRQRKHRVDRVRWRTAVAIAEIEVERKLFRILAGHFEAGQVVFHLDHPAELLKILARRRSLDAQKFFN